MAILEYGAFWKVGFLLSEIPMRFYTASVGYSHTNIDLI